MSAPITDAHLDQAIADMTNAFLRWPLPESVNADGCATRQGKGRSGTNLMSVGETLTMMQEVVRPIVAQLIADSEAKAVVEIAMVAAESADRNVSLRLERDQLRAERDWLKTWQDQAETNYVIGEPLAKKLRDTEAERDKLRGALALGQQNCDDAYDDLRAERDAARAEVGRLKTERYKYTDDPEMVFTDDFGWLHVIVKEEIDELIARAELAEADKARIDWLEAQENKRMEQAGVKTDDLPFLVVGEDGKTHWGQTYRNAIDAAMKGAAK